jgi:hypothetical protein
VPCAYWWEAAAKILANKNDCCFPPSWHVWFGHLWFHLVSENEKTLNDGIIFRMSLKFGNNHWTSCTCFQKVRSCSGRNAGLLRNLGKGLLWSGQNWPIIEAGVCLVTNSALKVMDIPS